MRACAAPLFVGAVLSLAGCSGGDSSAIPADAAVVSRPASLEVLDLTETTATLSWALDPATERYRIWRLAVGDFTQVAPFPQAPWEVLGEDVSPPFLISRSLEHTTTLLVLEGMRGAASIWNSAPVDVAPAVVPAAPQVAVGAGVAWLVWDATGIGRDLAGNSLDWQILRDDELIDVQPSDPSSTSYRASYLDLGGLVAGQRYTYRIARKPRGDPGGPPGLQTQVTIVSWAQVDAFSNHSCARTAGGAGYCWGQNIWGELGTADTTPHTGAVQVVRDGAPLTNITDIAVGERTSCALDGERRVWCWGISIADPAVKGPPAEIPLPVRPETITLGRNFACVLAAGEVWCWGANDSGQLGRGGACAEQDCVPAGIERVLGPDRRAPLSNIVELSAGASHTCARSVEGEIWCWGDSASGQQLGPDSDVAVAVRGVGVATRVWAGGDSSCALSDAGRLRCWGPSWPADLTAQTPELRDLSPGEPNRGEAIVALALGRPSVATTSFGRAYRSTGDPFDYWGEFADDAFAVSAVPRFAASGEGFACLQSRDGLLLCEADCNSGQPYDWRLGCAGNRPGTAGLNTLQGADVVRVVMEPRPAD